MKVPACVKIRILYPALLLFLVCPGLAAAVGRPYLVKNINPSYDGIDSTLVRPTASLGTSLIFTAHDGTSGLELWKSDGTEQWTQQLTDIRPGTSGSSPANMTTVGAKVFFTANDGSNGTELWVTDGTAGGTRLVKDIYTGSSGSNPANLVAFNGRLFFTATSAENGTELWSSDGSPEGTTLFREFTTGTSGTTYGSLSVVDGSLLIPLWGGSSWEFWESDGTSAGTQLVRSGFNSQPQYFTLCNGKIYFQGSITGNGPELWQTDGSDSGTLLVKDINVGNTGSYPAALTCVDTTIFFAANNGLNGNEVWKSDGTPDGTVLVKDIYGGTASSSPSHLTALNGKLLFSANTPETGLELWQSDGTPEGTTLLADLAPGTGYSSPVLRFVADGKLFFSANTQLWVTDGTPAGTYRLSDNTYPANLTRIGNSLYFTAYGEGIGNELWVLSLEKAPLTRIVSPQSGTALNTSQTTVSGEAHGDGATIVLTEVSVDGGSTWAPATGTTAWSYSATFPGDGLYTVLARSTDSLAVVESTPAAAPVVIDTVPPTATLAINDNASFTPYQAVTLSLTASVTEAGLDCAGKIICGSVMVRFSNDGTSWGFWQTASASTQWDLGSVNGLKTVYAQVKDRAGNTAQTSASITMDTSVVPTVSIFQPFDNSIFLTRSVTVNGGATDHSGTGLNRVEISLNRVTWSPVASGTTSWSHTFTNLADGLYSVYVRSVDNSDYISQIDGRQFLVDATPIAGSVVINGGAPSTSSPQVTLTLSANDPWTGGICVQIYPPPFGCEAKRLYMQFSTDNVNWSGTYPYATTMSWNLGNSNTIYVRYTNQYGMTSPVYSDSIIVATPTSSIQQPAGNSFINQGTVVISGIAAATEGGTITRVDVSTDNGATWQAASGTTSWILNWSPSSDKAYSIKSRAVDSNGNIEIPAAAVTITIDRTPPSGTIVYDYNYDSYYLNAAANDPGMGCTTVFPNVCGPMEILLPGNSTWQTASIFLPYGTQSLTLRDRAGNTTYVSQPTSYGFPVRLEQSGTTRYSTIQQAFNSAMSGTVMKLATTNFTENLIFGRGIALALRGGFNNTFSTVTGTTSIVGTVTVQSDDLDLQDIGVNGAITVSGGSLTLNNVVCQ